MFDSITLLALLVICNRPVAGDYLYGLPAAIQDVDCSQVHCTVDLCARDMRHGNEVAHFGLAGIMGPDCGAWSVNAPADKGEHGSCARGLRRFTGEFIIWRAWVTTIQDVKYQARFAPITMETAVSGRFLGAECRGSKRVTCRPKGNAFPFPPTGMCVPLSRYDGSDQAEVRAAAKSPG